MALKYVTAAKPTYSKVANTASYQAPTFESKYGSQLDSALNNVTNFKYDPLQDASYRQLAKSYNQLGNQAARNTMGEVAALNGGYGSSYAATAANQQRSQYNQQLAAMIPDLEDRAYNRATGTLNALRDADNTDYGRYRDTTSDAQWQYSQDYQAWRDAMADSQWQYSTDLNQYLADRDYNMQVYNQKKSGGGGGGGRRSSGGGGGSYSSGYGGGSGGGVDEALFAEAKKKIDGLLGGSGSSGRGILKPIGTKTSKKVKTSTKKK